MHVARVSKLNPLASTQLPWEHSDLAAVGPFVKGLSKLPRTLLAECGGRSPRRNSKRCNDAPCFCALFADFHVEEKWGASDETGNA